MSIVLLSTVGSYYAVTSPQLNKTMLFKLNLVLLLHLIKFAVFDVSIFTIILFFNFVIFLLHTCVLSKFRLLRVDVLPLSLCFVSRQDNSSYA